MQIGWVNSWFEQCRVDPWWCYSKLLNFYVPPWNTYTVWVEETCANACRNHHAMLYCTASDIRPFKHSFEVHLVCVMQFSLLELVDVVKLFDFIVWFSNVSPKLTIIWFPGYCHALWCKKQCHVLPWDNLTHAFFQNLNGWWVQNHRLTNYPNKQTAKCAWMWSSAATCVEHALQKNPDRSPAASPWCIEQLRWHLYGFCISLAKSLDEHLQLQWVDGVVPTTLMWCLADLNIAILEYVSWRNISPITVLPWGDLCTGPVGPSCNHHDFLWRANLYPHLHGSDLGLHSDICKIRFPTSVLTGTLKALEAAILNVEQFCVRNEVWMQRGQVNV